jgi:hypothetical protein
MEIILLIGPMIIFNDFSHVFFSAIISGFGKPDLNLIVSSGIEYIGSCGDSFEPTSPGFSMVI